MTMMNNDPSSQPSSPQAEASPKPIKPQQLTLPRQLPLPQFSIWTVMVFTAFVLLAASHWWTSIQLDLARKHVKRAEEKVRETHDNAYDRILKVRSEMQRGLNHLDIDQYDQTHVGFLPQSATHFWQWRIRIPEGCRYRLYFMLDFPYQSKRTEADWNIILEPGEGMVSFRIVQITHGEFEVIRTIDWIDERNQRPEPAPVRVVDIRELDVTENSWLRGVWDPLVIEGPFAWGSDYTAIKTKHYEVQTLDGMGYLQQKAYDPRDLIPLVDFTDPNGKQTEGVYIWLEPVKEQ